MKIPALLLAACPLAAASLQQTVDSAMAGRDGTVVVLDAAGGRVLGSHRLERARALRVSPGSTVKPFTLLALPPVAPLVCETRMTIAGRRLDCSHPALALPIDGEMALAYSCNWFFTRASARLRPADFAAFLNKWGFAARISTETALQAIGEQDVEVTPYGLAEAYRRLGAEASGPVRRGLRGAVEFGSGQLARAGTAVAGKTGTTLAPTGTFTHAWFAGWAPEEKPQVIVVVYLERGRGGSNAAPVAGEIFRAWAGGAR